MKHNCDMIKVATIQDEEQPSRLHHLQGVVIQGAVLLIAVVVLGLTLIGQGAEPNDHSVRKFQY